MLWYLQTITRNCCVFAIEGNYYVLPQVCLHNTSVIVMAFKMHTPANISLKPNYCSVKAGHPVPQVVHEQQNAVSYKEEVTTGVQKSNWSKCYLYFSFQLSPWDTFYVLSVVYITSIEEFRRGIRKPAPCIKWKILIHLSESKAVLASRRETTPVHSDATRQPSAKTP